MKSHLSPCVRARFEIILLIFGCYCFLIFSHSLPLTAQKSTPTTPTSDDEEIKQIIEDYWNSREKFFLIVTVPRPSEPSFQPIDWVDKDGKLLEDLLRDLKYKPLHDRISGNDGGFHEVTSAIDQIHKGPNEKAIVLVYFSGHGKAGEQSKDLDLLLTNSDIELARLVRRARGGSTQDPSYKGKLIFVIDACDAGYGIWHSSLTAEDFIYPTVILTSSSVDQKSVKLKSKDESAFTSTVEEAATTLWKKADENADGFLEYGELQQYAEDRLRQLKLAAEIPNEMKPQMEPYQHLFLAYRRNEDTRPTNLIHRNLLGEILQEISGLAATRLSSNNSQATAPELPPIAKEIARLMKKSEDEPAIAQGYKALAEGKFEEATTQFIQARESVKGNPRDLETVETAIARTALFSRNFQLAKKTYLSLAKSSTNSKLLAETGVSLTLSGNSADGSEFLVKAASLQKKEGQSEAKNLALFILTLPAKAIGLQRKKKIFNGDIQPELATTIPLSVAVAYIAGGVPEYADPFISDGIRAARQLEDSNSPQYVRTAAQSYGTAAAISMIREDRATSIKLYEHATSLFERIDDKSSEYKAVLLGYREVLKSSKQDKGLIAVDTKLKGLGVM